MTPAAAFPSGFLKFVLIAVIALGGYRTLMGGVGLLTSALMTRDALVAQLEAPARKGTPAEDATLHEVVGRVADVQFELRSWGLALGVVSWPVSLGLIIAGVGAWRRREAMRRALVGLCVAAVPLQVLTLVFTVVSLMRTSGVMGDYLQALFPRPAAAGGDVALAIGRFTSMLGAFVGIGFALLSLVLFIVAALRLTRADVRAQFAG
ncbi:MAG: hypothetical protein ACOZQL_08150 [Myxococcota bacterium]